MNRKHRTSKRLYQVDEFNNLKEMLANTKEKFSNQVAFKFKTEVPGKLRTETHGEFNEKINALGTALISIGLKDKRIAIIGENRYEWGLSYLAVVAGTGIVVPLDKSLPENEIVSLIERSEVEAIFYTSKYDNIMNKIREDKVGKLKFFISMDEDKTDGGIYSQSELVELGKGLIRNGARSFLDAEIDNEAMSIMLFTSGTTSKSKCVMLSHKNIVSNLHDISALFDINKDDTLLSFLPLHHTFENTVGFLLPISVGGAIAYCDGIRYIADNLKEYQISVMISVPLLFESMYKKVMHTIDKKGKTKKVKFGIMLSNFLRKFGIDKRRTIFKEIHESLGGKLRLFVAGAAAFDPVLEKGLNDLGIDTYQGYGLTEASPVIAAEHKTETRYGSIGRLFPSLEGKIIEPNEQGIGELAVKGPSVMLGYYQNEEATNETIVDGWLHTGDLAYFDKDDFIFITGRKKNVIVLKNGKNIFPEELEILINKIEGIKESMVYGMPEDGDLTISAKVVYDKKSMQELYGLNEEDKIEEFINEEIKKINKTMPAYKYIRNIMVTEEELIKTTTLKIKRHEEMKKILNAK